MKKVAFCAKIKPSVETPALTHSAGGSPLSRAMKAYAEGRGLLTSDGTGSNFSQQAPDPGDLHVIVSTGETAHEVRLLGELDMATASELREALDRLVTDGASLVTLDLSDLAFIDSTGLSVLITGLKSMRQQGGELVLRSPAPGIRKVLEITGLTEVFSIS